MSILHGAGLSPFVRKVRVALMEKGIAYELDPVVPFGISDEYKKISPLGKIPCYTPKDGVNIPDSTVIIAYLEKTHSETPLYPSDPEDFARALFLEEYADTALVAGAGVVFFQRIVGPIFLNAPTDQDLIKDAIENVLPPVLAWLEEQIGDREFFVGDRLSVADIAVASPLINFMHAGETLDAAKYPQLTAFLARMLERDSFAALLAEEKELLAPAA